MSILSCLIITPQALTTLPEGDNWRQSAGGDWPGLHLHLLVIQKVIVSQEVIVLLQVSQKVIVSLQVLVLLQVMVLKVVKVFLQVSVSLQGIPLKLAIFIAIVMVSNLFLVFALAPYLVPSLVY